MDKILGFIMPGFDVDTLFAAGGCCHADQDYCQRPWAGDSKTGRGADVRGMALDGCCHADVHTNVSGQDYCPRPFPWTGDSEPRRGIMARDPSSQVYTLSPLRMGHSSGIQLL